MFTYLDAEPYRPSLESLFELYWDLMPRYQGVALEQLEFRRLLFGMFPTYRQSPLPPGFDRVLQVGDASGIQSPLSFGGFGALTRHLPRLVGAVREALDSGSLDRDSLSLINPYLPNLSATWLFQRTMSLRQGQAKKADFINRVMGGNFKNMQRLGPAVMMPFLQDVVQFGGLGSILASQIAGDPLFVPQILGQLEPALLLDWLGHFGAMGGYELAHNLLGPLVRSAAAKLPPSSPERFRLHRLAEAWEFGSGLDYH